MACSQFNPYVPHSTAEEQAVWLRGWTANLYTSGCMQRLCPQVCLPGNPLNSAACVNCLQRNQCNSTVQCVNCVADNSGVFADVYACTVSPGLSAGAIVGIVVGSVVAFLALAVIVTAALYRSGRMPVRWRVSLDLWLARLRPDTSSSASGRKSREMM